MQSLSSTIPHGVVFLYDPTMIVDVPPDTSSAPLLATQNCVSIWTLGEYDGHVTLMLGSEEKAAEGRLIFDGFLDTHGRNLAFNDSGCDSLLSINVLNIKTRIRVYSDHPRFPTVVCCIAGD